jgi:hypothetical protein
LIDNVYGARYYDFELPAQVDWDKVSKGVDICINSMIEQQVEGQQLHKYIDKSSYERYTDDELKVYQKIWDAVNGDIFSFSNNRKMYIEENISLKYLDKNSIEGFDELIVLLGEQLKSAMSKGKTISAKFLKEFISNVNELKSELENQNIDN